jgi:hypothetical protein
MTQGLNIRAIAVFVIAIILAIWLGVSIVTDQMETLLKFAGVGLLLLCVFLGRRIWLLVVFLSAINVPLVRGYGTAELGQCILIGFGVLLLLMRRLPTRFIMGELEWWRLILAACIIQVYLRNPVGLGLFGAGQVGGKSYFLAALAFIASFIYGSLIVPARELKWAMYIGFFTSLIGIPISELRTRSGLATIEASELGEQRTIADEGAATRVGYLGGVAITLSRWIASRVHPLKACFHPLWGPLILITLAAAAGSGFRNTIAIVGLTYVISLAYRGGIASILIASTLGVFGIGALCIVNLTAPLPPNVQRALTIFPGTWEQRYKDDAKGSSEWRYEMWEEALLTDRWIQNKWLGDGLGQSAAELNRAATLSSLNVHQGISGISVHQENAMASGDYHSGPVQTIRTVGYVGLAVLILFMIRLAIYAHRQILRCRGTEWFPMSLYYCIGTIAAPFIFIFVFGDFGRATVSVFMGSAFLRVLQNNIPLPPYVHPRRAHYYLTNHHSPNAPQGG